MIRILSKRIREFKKLAILTPIFMIGEVFMEVLIPFLMSLIIDKGISTGDLGYTFRMSLLLILAAFFSMSFGLLGAHSAARASAGFSRNIRHDLYYRIQDFSFSNIDSFNSSSLITRLTTDVQNVQMAFQMIIRMFVRAPIMFFFAILMVIKNGGSLAFTYAVSIPFIVFLILFVISKAHPLFTKGFKSYDDLNRVVNENLAGIRTVKAYVREEEEERKFKKASGQIYDNFTRAQKIMSFTQPGVMAIMYSCIIALSYLGARMINVGTMTTGQLLSLYTYNTQILMSLIMIGMFVVMITISRASAERIVEVLTTEPDMDRNEDGETVVSSGSVEFDHVDFGYKKGTNVLEDISFRIEEGEMVGILGTTGSGKSTLISLIARLYDVSSGSVKVGGLDVRSYNLKSLRDEVAIVLQKNTLFSGTLRENLKWGDKDASDEDIRWALDVANASGFVDALSDGYDSHVEQGGTNFSGGQRQRLCIARALLKKPRILIMDDSTSAVDTKTDRMIKDSLRNDVKGLTKIIIAQRLSSVMDADKIIILDNGRIADIGTHEELMARNEHYQDLYETQMKGKEA